MRQLAIALLALFVTACTCAPKKPPAEPTQAPASQPAPTPETQPAL